MAKVTWRLLVALLALTLVAAACGDDESTDAGDPTTDDGGDADGDGHGDGGGDDVGDDVVGDDAADDAGDDDMGDDMGDDDVDNNATGDNNDIDDITGNPDLEDGVGDLGDEIDDIVSLGDCVIETLSLVADLPADDLQCRVLDNPLPGFDGFTMFNPGNTFTITLGTPLPGFGNPCDLLPCENQTDVDIPGFGNAFTYDSFGTGNMFGNHDEYEIDLGVVKTDGLLTDDDIALVQAVAESLRMA